MLKDWIAKDLAMQSFLAVFPFVARRIDCLKRIENFLWHVQEMLSMELRISFVPLYLLLKFAVGIILKWKSLSGESVPLIS